MPGGPIMVNVSPSRPCTTYRFEPPAQASAPRPRSRAQSREPSTRTAAYSQQPAQGRTSRFRLDEQDQVGVVGGDGVPLALGCVGELERGLVAGLSASTAKGDPVHAQRGFDLGGAEAAAGSCRRVPAVDGRGRRLLVGLDGERRCRRRDNGTIGGLHQPGAETPTTGTRVQRDRVAIRHDRRRPRRHLRHGAGLRQSPRIRRRRDRTRGRRRLIFDVDLATGKRRIDAASDPRLHAGRDERLSPRLDRQHVCRRTREHRPAGDHGHQPDEQRQGQTCAQKPMLTQTQRRFKAAKRPM